MDQKTLLLKSIELMGLSEAAYLTTIDNDGFPETRAMLNLRNKSNYPNLIEFFDNANNDFLTYFTTNTSSGKILQIMANPNVCVYYCLPNEWRGLMLQGKIENIIDIDIKKAIWQDRWTMYYPQGIEDPDYSILRLEPSKLKIYHQLNTFSMTLND